MVHRKVVVAGVTVQAHLNQLNGPEDLQVDSAGNIFFADVYNYRIMRWAPGASCGEIVAGGNGPGAALNQFNWPNALSLDRFGNIYVADVYNNRIVKWKPGAKCVANWLQEAVRLRLRSRRTLPSAGRCGRRFGIPVH